MQTKPSAPIACNRQSAIGIDRFCIAWRHLAIGFEPDHCASVFQELDAIYSQHNRHYHGIRHISHCLAMLDEARDFQLVDAPHHADNSRQPKNADVQDTDIPVFQHALMELALWFHDAVYVPGRPDNESHSATLFRNMASGYLAEHFITKICDLIVATEHSTKPASHMEQLMVDIDLSSFARDQPAFLRDSYRLRQEFHTIPDKEYIWLQTRFLTMLLHRKSVYRTRLFKDRYESRARNNIARLLQCYKLGQLPGPDTLSD